MDDCIRWTLSHYYRLELFIAAPSILHSRMVHSIVDRGCLRIKVTPVGDVPKTQG